ncbi:MAG TPA: hypothetical protein VMW24_27255 [Sedimentisphaerales bacterium]|nr:hypothetical protein [Sedimentisphaerales bacterium]
MPDENSHGLIVAAAGQVAAGEQLLGQVTLPADGPWIIHNIFGQIVPVTPTAAEGVGGYMLFRSASGDIDPNPAPCHWPVVCNSATLGATIDQAVCQLHMYDVLWQAPGRATIDMLFNNVSAATVAPQIVMGILFGKSVPEKKRFLFCDSVTVQTNSAADTAVGTITLAEKATRITGICGTIFLDGVLVTVQTLLGFFRLASDDIDLVPAQYPFPMAFGGGLGALINGASAPKIDFIPVDIPVVGGARINCFVDLSVAVTNNAQVQIFIAYE